MKVRSILKTAVVAVAAGAAAIKLYQRYTSEDDQKEFDAEAENNGFEYDFEAEAEESLADKIRKLARK